MSDLQIREYLINRIIDKLTEYYMTDNNVSLEESLDKVYSSNIYDLLLAPGSYLPSQSPDYVYDLLKAE